MMIFFPGGLMDKKSFLRHMKLDRTLVENCEAYDFNALHTLLQIMAHSYTIALGEEKLFGINGDDAKLSLEEKNSILEQLSEAIVADVWPAVHSESLDTVRQGNKVVRDRGKEAGLSFFIMMCCGSFSFLEMWIFKLFIGLYYYLVFFF